jgi:putative Mn2+ efflux pump MntP
MFNLTFFINSILLGVGLAMDAFSVSLANGLNEPDMKRSKHALIAVTFSFFQFCMPLIGWLCVHTVLQYFSALETAVPWIALALLGFIGGKMLYEGIKHKECEECRAATFSALIVQGVATSIDALSAGFTISDYSLVEALVCGGIIAVITFGLCLGGVAIGKRFGTKLSGYASILGGAILIIIGLEIFIKSFFG